MKMETTLIMRKTTVVIGLVGSYLLSGCLAARAVDETNISAAISAASPAKIAPKTLEFLEATELSGYVQSSYQKSWGANGTAGDPGSTPARVFNLNRNGFDVDQVKVTLEKPVGDGEAGAGYRVDLLYGMDASRIAGNNNSFLLEQAYVQFRIPVGTGLDVKLGRFVTLLGNEVIDAPGNWNYSRSYIFNSEPLTHTGALLSYTFSKADEKNPVGVDAQLGVVNGYSDTAGVNGAADNNSAKSVTGRVGVSLLGGDLVFSTIGIGGGEKNGNNSGERLVLDEVVTYNATKKLSFALEGIYGRESKMGAGVPEAAWYGVAGYGKYQWMPHFSTALRAESFSFNGSAQPMLGWNNANGVSALTSNGAKGHVEDLTMSFSLDNIWKNLTPRFEVRYDRVDPSIFGNAGDGYKNGIFTASLDIIYAF